ncbi:hypothetical protein F4818DRAFT_438340 [Hypoxylon cercidicola]|nr:hypothetical protein F4818DRAFT_438340 [Hypoxylon cercidicola]
MVSFAFLSLLVPSVLDAALARPSSRAPMAPFVNATRSLNIAATCFPFEDPHCCVNRPVCECANGTFYSANPQRVNETTSLCGPPGNITYGEDTGTAEDGQRVEERCRDGVLNNPQANITYFGDMGYGMGVIFYGLLFASTLD